MFKKINYTKSITTDDGKLLIIQGWYYEDAPYIGKSVITEIDLVKIETELVIEAAEKVLTCK
jgi:hypothetical protein